MIVELMVWFSRYTTVVLNNIDNDGTLTRLKTLPAGYGMLQLNCLTWHVWHYNYSYNYTYNNDNGIIHGSLKHANLVNCGTTW